MKTKWLTMAGVTAAMFLGCVPSANPLYTQKDLTFDPALVGTWGDEGDKESWAFEKAGDKKYKVVQKDKEGRDAEFDAYLVKLQDHLFLDILATKFGDEEWKINGYAAFSLIIKPGHMFLKVSQVSPTLKMSFLNPDWLQKLLEKDPKAIRHETMGQEKDKRFYLTASTAELQKFLLAHVNDEDAFGDGSELKRLEVAKPKAEAK